MENDGIDDSYDVIVYGTGLQESILAAACAKAGLSVFHFDKNAYYGQNWTSFNLDQLVEWAIEKQNALTDSSDSLNSSLYPIGENERLISFRPTDDFSNIEFEWLISDSGEGHQPIVGGSSTEEVSSLQSLAWTKPKLLDLSRRFSIDICPKVLLSRGHAIDTLVDSRVSRYAEFKLVDRILTLFDDKLLEIPCSKAEVFQTQQLDIVEKRVLMKFLSFCANFREQSSLWEDYKDAKFRVFLESQQLSKKLQHYVLFPLANGDVSMTTEEGLTSINDFLNATGRYGNSPYLWTMYGSGELPQCFSRMCAVFGGTYCLRRPLQAIVVDQEKNVINGIVSQKRINCNKAFICGRSSLSDVFASNEAQPATVHLSRGILITNKSILEDGDNHISLLNLNIDGSETTVKILEVGHCGLACPKGLYIVYLSRPKINGAKSDLMPVIDKLYQLEGQKDAVLWQMFYNHKVQSTVLPTTYSPFSNLVPTGGPDSSLHYDFATKEARSLFEQFFAIFLFFPPAAENEDQDDEEITEPQHNPGPSNHNVKSNEEHDSVNNSFDESDLNVPSDVDGCVKQADFHHLL